MMTSLERVGTALQHKEPDRVPAIPLIGGIARRVYGVTYAEWAQDGELAAKCALQTHDLIGHDGILAFLDLSVEAADFGQRMVYPTEDTPHPEYDDPYIKNPDDYYKIARFDPTKSPRMKEVLKFTEIVASERADTMAVMGFIYGPLGILSMMRGAEKLFRDCYKHQEAVITAVETITDVLVDYAKAQSRLGVHAIALDTLFASQTIMSKEMWAEIEGPSAQRLAETIREGGQMVMIHNCGNGPYFDAQIEAMQPVAISCAYMPADCNSWVEAKEKYGHQTTICGYMEPAKYAFLGTPVEVREECKKEIGELAAGGGFVLATGCEFPPNGSLLNAIAMVEAAELYGKYNN